MPAVPAAGIIPPFRNHSLDGIQRERLTVTVSVVHYLLLLLLSKAGGLTAAGAWDSQLELLLLLLLL